MNSLSMSDKLALAGSFIYLVLMLLFSMNGVDETYTNRGYIQGVGESRYIQENVVPKVVPQYQTYNML